MRKMLVIARREYAAAVKTKAFIIGLVLMPIMMLGSVIVQKLVEGIRDTKTKTFAVIDRSGVIYPVVEDAVGKYNDATYDTKLEKQVKPRFDLRQETPSVNDPDAIAQQRYELSELVRKGKLYGFLDIGPDVMPKKSGDGKENPTSPNADSTTVYFYSNRATPSEFSQKVGEKITEAVQTRRAEAKHLTLKELQEAAARVDPVQKGLYKLDRKSGKPKPSDQSRFASFFVPFILIMLMFMVIMSGATPLMQGIVEEKMQRIAEVLLGAVTPFQLMMGKLLGMTAVSLTIGGVYLAGAFWAATHFEWTEYVTPGLLIWFLVYQTLAVLMFGALFIAIGAGCSDMKETQNLLGPVMIIICLPLFMIVNVIQEPNGPVATGMSFFPFATPMLMVARLAVPPGVDVWQPILGVVLVLLTTIAAVWVASRIFRVGILMQGKGAKLGEMMRWVFKG